MDLAGLELTAEEEELIQQDAPSVPEKGTEPAPPTEVPIEPETSRADTVVSAEEFRRRNAALRETRGQLAEVKERLRQREVEEARLTERLNLAMAIRQAEQQRSVQPPPDPREDPDAYRDYQLLQTRQEVENLKAQVAQTAQQAYDANQRLSYRQDLNTQVNEVTLAREEFKRGHPDFDDAFKYLVSTRDEELSLMGYGEDQRREVIMNEAGMIANGCYDLRTRRLVRNPAEVAYNLAVKRGYQGTNGATVTTAADERVERIQRGQRTSPVGGMSGGASPTGRIDLRALNAMSDDEFFDFAKKHPRAVDALMGRSDRE